MEVKEKKILVQSVSAVLIIVVLFNVYSGITVSKIGIPGLIDIEFNSGNESSDGPVAEQGSRSITEQGQNVDRPSDLIRGSEETLSNNSGASDDSDKVYIPVQPDPVQPALLDLNGMWYGEDGSEYEFVQTGGTVYFTEYGLFGATAQGSGSYQSNRLILEYETAFGTVGKANLNLSQNGQVLSGQANDITSGAITQLYLRRY
jgi:hypothetical protein